jgi:hypothetical protein
MLVENKDNYFRFLNAMHTRGNTIFEAGQYLSYVFGLSKTDTLSLLIEWIDKTKYLENNETLISVQ